MKAQEFWESFQKEINKPENETILKKYWHSEKSGTGETEFTKQIKEVLKKVIKNTKSVYEFRDGYHTQTEYYRIDLIGWEQKNDSEKIFDVEDGIDGYHLNKHAWDFDIALEHENDIHDWSDEIVKLAYIHCKLRVVIGYFPYLSENKEKMQLKYLNEVAKAIQNLNCKDNMNCGDFMVILGDVSKEKRCGFEELKYTPYIYKGVEFKPLLKGI